MSNKNYVAGRNLEYKRKKVWESKGYTVMRTAGSHGVFDLIAFAPYEVVGIQCKKVSSVSAANNLIRKFENNPPLTTSDVYRQVLEVYVSSTRQMLSSDDCCQ